MTDIVTIECPPASPTMNTDPHRYTWTYRRGKAGLEPLNRVRRKRTKTVVNIDTGMSFMWFDDGSQYVSTPCGDVFETIGLMKWLAACRGETGE